MILLITTTNTNTTTTFTTITINITIYFNNSTSHSPTYYSIKSLRIQLYILYTSLYEERALSREVINPSQ